MGKMRGSILLAVSVLVLVASACSPEASRRQGGGAGADVGNRTPTLELQGQSNMYYRTPPLVPLAR